MTQEIDYQNLSQQIVSSLFKSSKVHSINPSFEELHQFRQQVEAAELGPFHQPYLNQKLNTNIYRSIFAGIALCFFILMCFVHFRTASWICNLFFAHFVLAKTTLSAICGSLAVAAALIAFQMKPEKEAVMRLYRRAKNKLFKRYLRKCAELGVSAFSTLFLHPVTTKQLRDSYHEHLDKIHDLKDAVISLLACVSKAEQRSDQREKLFNQAIIEFREHLSQIIQKFAV